MARPLRIQFPGAVYHVMSRGNAGGKIFLSDRHRQLFLSLLATAVERFNLICHAYCLMDNHYHLLIETPEANLSLSIKHINGVYTQAFNRFESRFGHLFQGRYKAIIVEKEGYLLELCRYIVLNPVRAGIVKHPADYSWSSFRETAGLRERPPFIAVDWILSQFAAKKSLANKRYHSFILEDQAAEFNEKLKNQLYLGSEDFIKGLKEKLDDTESLREIPRCQRYIARPSLIQVFQSIPRQDRIKRNTAIKEAVIAHGYALKEIADFLGLHYTTVSKGLNDYIQKSDNSRPDPIHPLSLP